MFGQTIPIYVSLEGNIKLIEILWSKQLEQSLVNIEFYWYYKANIIIKNNLFLLLIFIKNKKKISFNHENHDE